jgi:hypothetical protein
MVKRQFWFLLTERERIADTAPGDGGGKWAE